MTTNYQQQWNEYESHMEAQADEGARLYAEHLAREARIESALLHVEGIISGRQRATYQKMAEHIADGAEIVVNANARYTGKRSGYTRVVRLAQTNSRRHGWPICVIWACYR